MSENLKVTVNDTYEFDLTKDAISSLDTIESSTLKYHVLQNAISYKTEILKSDFNKKTYSVKVNNNTYEVVIANALDQLIDKMGFSANDSKQIDAINAPMPGLLLEINVAVGQEVKKDDQLFILEAMKMENAILSPRDGVIKSVNANKGDAIEKNYLLIEFE